MPTNRVTSREKAFPPWGEFAPLLLKDIFAALNLLSKTPDVPDIRLDAIFQRSLKRKYFPSDFSVNRHLTRGLRVLSDRPKRSVARLTAITRRAFEAAQEVLGTGRGVYLPSPMQVLYEALTVPEESQSGAYALAVCRWMLFSELRVRPYLQAEVPPNDWTAFKQQDVRASISHFRTYSEHRDNIERTTHPTQLFVAHFLAMKGVFRFRFASARESAEEERRKRSRFCREARLIPRERDHEFRLAASYASIPDAAEIINEIWGVPIPIRGAETVFFGGLTPLSDGSLVVSFTGQPGTGKTSWGLALAATLAPLGTVTYYISVEERANDLYSRLVSLVPTYLTKLSIYNRNLRQWCFVEEFSAVPRTIESLTSWYLERIEAALVELRQQQRGGILPNACPLMVVIDGLSELSARAQSTDETPDSVLSTFLHKCRKLGVLVVLISGADCQVLRRLDYLVDVAFVLRYENTAAVDDQPFRILQLVKSRNQMSRPGSHLFHLSGEKGLRISPHIGSQLDRRRGLRQRLPNDSLVVPTLNAHGHFLDLYHGSRILLHGHGSSGKAGLALRILMTPAVGAKDRNLRVKRSDFALERRRQKVLVVSFLYPQEYYETLLRRLERSIKPRQRPQVEFLIFVAGFLRPQDLLGKIIRRMEAAYLEGEPFDGVLLDGLHNVFLQFPALRDDLTVWPGIYRYLSLHKLTTLSTFTTFEILRSGDTETEAASQQSVWIREARDSEELHLKGHLPFLNALVNAADFYLLLEAKGDLNQLSVRTAIGQRLPHHSIWWDRETLRFMDPVEVERARNQKTM